MKTGIIYKATSPSGKFYVGKTITSLEERMTEHSYHSRYEDKKYRNIKFYRAIRKYGFENFKWEIVEKDILESTLNEKERYYISLFNAYIDGYNSTLGGEGNSGLKHSEEAKLQMSQVLLGNKRRLGKKASEKTRKKLSDAHKGKTSWNKGKSQSEELNKKQSERMSGNKNPMHNKHHSEETKRKISESLRQKASKSTETCAMIS